MIRLLALLLLVLCSCTTIIVRPVTSSDPWFPTAQPQEPAQSCVCETRSANPPFFYSDCDCKPLGNETSDE